MELFFILIIVKKSRFTNYNCQFFINVKRVMSAVDSQFSESKDFRNAANVSNLFSISDVLFYLL